MVLRGPLLWSMTQLVLLFLSAFFLNTPIVTGQVATVTNTTTATATNEFSFNSLPACSLTTVELSLLSGPDDNVEPCVLVDLQPNSGGVSASQVITLVQVTPSTCGNHRDGAVTSVEFLNADNDGRGVAIGYAATKAATANKAEGGLGGTLLNYTLQLVEELEAQELSFVQFRYVSVVAGNPAALGGAEYERRHTQLLQSMIQTLNVQYIVGTCSFVAEYDVPPAQDSQTVLLAQVGPEPFYDRAARYSADAGMNNYVFGLHIDSAWYPRPAVQTLAFYAQDQERSSHPQQQKPRASSVVSGVLAAQSGKTKSDLPVRIISRTSSEFFYETCQSAEDFLKDEGFNNVETKFYDPVGDDNGDGVLNEFDEAFLYDLADQICPPAVGNETVSSYHPAIFVCTLTEQTMLLQRWSENGCRPVSMWLTAATWNWANENLQLVPYMQGGAQWHPAFRFGDEFFDNSQALLDFNQQQFGYEGTYDQVVSYAIPYLFAKHLQQAYRVDNNPQPLVEFSTVEGQERLRRAMMVLTSNTIFGPVAFNSMQRNFGRDPAGTQWLVEDEKLDDGIERFNTSVIEAVSDEAEVFVNVLVWPIFEAEREAVMPAKNAVGCKEGQFVNRTLWEDVAALLLSGCQPCPVDTFAKDTSLAQQCTRCSSSESTRNLTGQAACIVDENFDYISTGLLAFGYVSFAILALGALAAGYWTWKYQKTYVVKCSQPTLLALVIVGCLIQSCAILFLGVQTGYPGVDVEGFPSTQFANASCMASAWLYGIGFAITFSALCTKIHRIKLIYQAGKENIKVHIRIRDCAPIVAVMMAVELILLVTWQIVAPMRWDRVTISESDGFVIESVGNCSSDDSFYFMAAIAAFHVCCLFYALVLCFQTKEIDSDFAESSYISLAVAFMFQVLVLAIPIRILINDDASVEYFVAVGFLLLSNLSVLALLFIPKMIKTQTDKNANGGPRPKPKSMSIQLGMLTNSVWDEAVDSINELLQPGSETYEAMTERQRDQLEKAKLLLLEGVQGDKEDRLLHVPRGLFKKNVDNTFKFIVKEFGGVNVDKLRADMAKQDPSETEMMIADEEDCFVPPEFLALSKEAQLSLFKLLSWSHLKSWDFNIFDIVKVTKGNPLLFVGWAVIGSPHSQYSMAKICGREDATLEEFKGYHFATDKRLNIPLKKLCNYIREIEQDYCAENPYHNAIHAADVVQTLHALIQMKLAMSQNSTEDLFTILLAAVVHDVDHPGENNAFQKNSQTDLALIYNDVSILENRHASHAFMKMLGHEDPGESSKKEKDLNSSVGSLGQSRRASHINFGKDSQLNVLCNVDQETLHLIRSKVIEAVLHTDMSKHFHSVNSMKGLIACRTSGMSSRRNIMNCDSDSVEEKEQAWKILTFMLHLADISNPAKPAPLFKLWTDRCLEEFFAQGDKEAALGLPISLNCDRSTTKRPDSQIGFIKFVIYPAYEVLAKMIPLVAQRVLPVIDDNLEYWEDEKEKEGKTSGAGGTEAP